MGYENRLNVAMGSVLWCGGIEFFCSCFI